jgi:cell division protein FtsW (lipid II flippase)
VNFLFPSDSDRSRLQSVLLTLAAAFVFLVSVALSLAPAVRYHSWNAGYNWKHWLGFITWLAAFSLLHRQVTRKIPHLDAYLIPIMAILSGWGLLTIWRLNTNLGLKQTLWMAVCTLLFTALLRISSLLDWLKRYKYIWLISGLGLTALTFVLGTYPEGAGPNLWLGCCGVYLQPSEPLKLLLLVYLAGYMADRITSAGLDLKLLFPTFLLISAALGILLLQRDLGTAIIFIALYFTMLFLSTGKNRILIIALITLIVAATLGMNLIDIIHERLVSWINPWLDPSGKSFQIIQSLLAVAAGGVFGAGFGLGSPGVIPVVHSDFIFSAIAEESGLAGGIGVILLLAILLVRGFKISLNAPNRYLRFLAAGITTYFIVQSVLIIGGNLRLLPLTGVTLPFISYGGSSLLTSFLAMLFLVIISGLTPEEKIQIPSIRQYLLTGRALLALLVCIVLINGWWGFIKADELLTRNDNPRRWINDFYVWRGAILDRNNTTIVTTNGSPGTYGRDVLYPPLSPVAGFSDYIYGQAGLESSLDAYLRGTAGTPSSQIWLSRMLYNQTPTGLDVRLSIDLGLQGMVDLALGDHKGAAVFLNARTGEILAMASHPYFDSNQILSKWSEYTQDQNAPLLNRATQGQYPAGTAIGPFLMVSALNLDRLGIDLPQPGDSQLVFINGKPLDCALEIEGDLDWAQAIANGCPRALQTLASSLYPTQVEDLYDQLGFNQTPEIPLPSVQANTISFQNSEDIDILGKYNPMISPLQMALAAAAFSSGGYCPSPNLAIAVDTPQQGWVILPGKSSTACLQPTDSIAVTEMLAVSQLPLWQVIGTANSPTHAVTWYLGGTTPEWQGTPLTLVIVLEEDAPSEALQMGYSILENALKPD